MFSQKKFFQLVLIFRLILIKENFFIKKKKAKLGIVLLNNTYIIKFILYTLKKKLLYFI